MDVSGVGTRSAIESSYAAGNATSQISMAVFKQQQEQEQRMAGALIEMIKNTPTPSLTGTGKVIDIFA